MKTKYKINIYNKDCMAIAEIDLFSLLEHYNILKQDNIDGWDKSGGRSIIIRLNNGEIYKVKGVGINKYTYHYGISTDPLYNKKVDDTNITYMPYVLQNPKLLRLPPNSIVINQAYQEFIGEPIGGIGLKEKNAFTIYKRLNEHGFTAKNLLAFKPIKWIEQPIGNNTLYFMVYKANNNVVYDNLLSLFDTKLFSIDRIKKYLLNIAPMLANVFYAFTKSKIIVPKDKNILRDIDVQGRYIDIADLYVGNDQLEIFMSLYLLFKELLIEHVLLSHEKTWLRKFLRVFLDRFGIEPKRGIFEVSDEVLMANFVAALLKIPKPKTKELNRFIETKLGVSSKDVGYRKPKMFYGFYYLDKFNNLTKSLYELFSK